MNRAEYMDQLKSALAGLNQNDISDICSDFEEHFDIGLSEGKSESDIALELGSPKEVAMTYLNRDDKDDNIIPEQSPFTSHATTNSESESAAKGSSDPVNQAISQTLNQTKAPPKDLNGPRAFVVLLNLLLMVWVWIGIYSTLIGFWGITAGLVVAAIALLSALAFLPAGVTAAIVLLALALISFSVASGILNFFLTKLTIIATKGYIKWNADVYNNGF
ncbi:MAG: DUF1700 domain-containing protein [Clostridiaceae bacterium]|nr:DUF1700 domain-containing protein [Clostridiaceae bacterium]